VLDLYRALYPVVHSSALASDADLAMRWSNDCRFLSDEITSLRTREGLAFAEDKWVETGERLKMLGEAWFEDVVVRWHVSFLSCNVPALIILLGATTGGSAEHVGWRPGLRSGL
jgi:hypothetical protein